MDDDSKNLGVGDTLHHHGERITIRRRRKSGMNRGTKLNLIQVVVALAVGLIVAIYIINQNHNEAPPPPVASISSYKARG